MINDLEAFFTNQPEPNKSCFLALKSIIQPLDEEITLEWKYKLPFFYYRGKMLCYLWKDKKTTYPYIGFVHGLKITSPALVQGDRAKMAVLPVDPTKDIDKALIVDLVAQSIEIEKNKTSCR